MNALFFSLLASFYAGTVAAQDLDSIETTESTIVVAEGPADISAAPSGEYLLDPFHKYLIVSYDHRGWSSPHLLWRDFDVTATVNSEDPSKNSVKIVVQADSADTGTDLFDGHMDNYFEVEKYPEITFISTEYEPLGPDKGKMHGDLTIRDISVPVTFDVTINHAGINEDPLYGVPAIGITAKTTVLRADWDILQQFAWVAPEMNIHAEIELIESEGHALVMERARKVFGFEDTP